MRKINQNSTRNENNNLDRIFRRYKEIIPTEEPNKELEIYTQEEYDKLETNNKSNYKKYFMLGSLLIVSGIIWYYWNDIKPGDGVNTVIEKIKTSRSWFSNDENNNINISTGNNQSNIQTNINSSTEDIQLVDKTQQPIVNTNLTSPSLENLNEQAESSWSEVISSPDSDRTITQSSISSNLLSSNWRSRLENETNEKINFIESCLSSINELNSENKNKLVDYFAYIVNEYNTEINIYNFMKSSSNYKIEHLNAMKESLYYFRELISEYKYKIFPDSTVTIEIGTIHDSPKNLSKNIID